MVDAIHRAAADGDAEEVTRLVAEGPRRLNLLAALPHFAHMGWLFNDRTPLMVAAYAGHDVVVEQLIALGAEMGLVDRYGDTAAHLAASSALLPQRWVCCSMPPGGRPRRARPRPLPPQGAYPD